ncbi:MAG: beta-ketoacyl synthase, partial [Porticoccaceae bacterium]|nr:beta-ketoacyl synthase [Porticoccaceae bacterium]
TFKYKLIPGIKTVPKIADDVNQAHLNFALEDIDVSTQNMEVAFINSKGFGGNNATAVVLSAEKTNTMLEQRYGDEFTRYIDRRGSTRKVAGDYEKKADLGQLDVIYRFGENMIEEKNILITQTHIHIPGYTSPIEFSAEDPWKDMQ